jgi:maleylacetoacetate isomerase/maleylpyruvate isomerase
MSTLKLYNYFRSSASYRVRIALHHKDLAFEYIPVHLVKNGGEQCSPEYRKLNPMMHVPTLIDGDFVLAESMAIFNYLDATSPKAPMFPADAKLRARTIQICEIVNSGIQPYQNLKVTTDFDKNGWDIEQRNKWVQKWVVAGLQSLEEVVSKSAGRFAVGGDVTAADAFIVPQLFSARRFKVDTGAYPTLSRIEKTANELPAFKKAHPEAQPDFEK